MRPRSMPVERVPQPSRSATAACWPSAEVYARRVSVAPQRVDAGRYTAQIDCLPLWGRYALLHRPGRDLDPRVESELVPDVFHVAFGRSFGDEQPGGDIAVALALRDHGSDFELAAAQAAPVPYTCLGQLESRVLGPARRKPLTWSGACPPHGS